MRKALASGDGEPVDEVTLKSYHRLNDQLDDASERVHRKDAECRKSDAVVAEHSAALTELRLEYDELFAARADLSIVARHHPVVRTSLRSDRCAVCGTPGTAQEIRAALQRAECPLCGSAVAAGADEGVIVQQLRALDGRIEEVRRELEGAIARRQRLKDEHTVAVGAEAAVRSRREEFLAANPAVQRHDPSEPTSGTVNVAIKRLELEAERFDSQSKKEYEARDRSRDALRRIEKDLRVRFDHHAERFTDLFRRYAEAFVGLSVDIELEHRGGKVRTGFDLLLSLEDQVRSRPDDVSESQRFFLDIALRMALAEFMCLNGATLLIDTPEGSLDITYEARAGQMFSDFAAGDNTILMTANLRSSALLHRLAERRKSAGMRIERMTDWTDLSEVQRAEERLFEEAYDTIQQALQ